MFLVRKITRPKWDTKPGLATDEIPADAVTADLRTQENTLSFWQSPSGATDDIERAALAIAAAGERLDRLDLVWLDEDELQADGQSLRRTEGRTPARDLSGLHVEVSHLDYSRLGHVASRVAGAIEQEQFQRLPKSRVKKLFISAIQQGSIDVATLSRGLYEEAQAELGSM